jgi:hypothetical protein
MPFWVLFHPNLKDNRRSNPTYFVTLKQTLSGKHPETSWFDGGNKPGVVIVCDAITVELGLM